MALLRPVPSLQWSMKSCFQTKPSEANLLECDFSALVGLQRIGLNFIMGFVDFFIFYDATPHEISIEGGLVSSTMDETLRMGTTVFVLNMVSCLCSDFLPPVGNSLLEVVKLPEDRAFL
mmetsp:Transcript_30408/g.57024  ORF Transcript_30408/g.57024 Transcript_30408/m.57024 type:complete len:119 (-) Transcript_30408:272-628(-)